MYQMSIYGGPLIRPLFTREEFTSDVVDPRDVSSVMFGFSVRADFAFTQFADIKEVRFPAGSKWLDLNTMEVLIAPLNAPLSIMRKVDIDQSVGMYQEQASVIALQDAKTYQVKRIEDLRQVPIQLSIVLNADQLATGFVNIEQGPISSKQTLQY